MGKVVGIRRGSVYDVETVKPNAKFTMTLFGTNLWPSRYDSIWLTDADHCVVIDKFSYDNSLVVELKDGIPEDDHLYLLCVKPSFSNKVTEGNIRVKLLASRSPYWMPFPLYTMIVVILLMVTMSALFSGLNLSFTSVAISELNIIIRMGDAYRSRLAKISYRCADILIGSFVHLQQPMLLLIISDGRLALLPLTLVTCIIIVVFGELFPLAICNRRGLQIASKTRYITWFAMIVLSPVVWPISKILDAALGFQEILKNAINLPRIRVGNVMTKINEAFLLSTTDALDNKMILSIVEKGYSRIPVYEGSKRSKVIAVLNVKDLITTDFNRGIIVIDILKKLNYLKQVRFVCEEMQVKPLMNEMEGQNFASEPKGYISHLAMVVKYDSKSYSLIGLITLDDIIEEIFGEMKDELFQWTNRRIGLHRDHATFDWLRSEPNPLAPLQEIYRIQETLENYSGFKELSFNIHTMRRLFNLCQIHSSLDRTKKFSVYKQGYPSRSVVVMLTGEAFYEDTKGIRIAATPFELGVELIQQIYLLCLDKGTSVNLNNLYFIPLKTIYVEPPFHYIKITVRAVLAAMQIIEVNEYRREVSEAKDTKIKEVISNNAEFSSLSSSGQKSTINKYQKKRRTDSTQTISAFSTDDTAKYESHGPLVHLSITGSSTPEKTLHRSVILPKQSYCSTLLRKEQTASTIQRWLFAESHKMEQSPDFLIAGIRDIYQKRLTIRSNIFINSILLPLESKDDSLVEFLQRSADTHVPFLLGLCGIPMSDATCEAKSVIADRLWNAFIHANIPITHAAMKSRLRTLIENEQTFDALEMLREAETAFSLEPDEELFAIILQELSMTGNINLVKEIERRKLSMNMEMKASQLYCYFKNDDNKVVELVQNAITEYGDKIEPLIFMMRCQLAIEKRNIQNFKLLMDSLSSSNLSLKLLTDEMVMKFVWLLARNGTDSMGKDHERLCTEAFLLEHILFSILTHKFLSFQKSLLLTLELLKILDPNCTKIHIVIPLLLRASKIEQRLEILAHFGSVGYSDLNHLNHSVIWKLLLQPLLGKNRSQRNKWNIEQFTRIVDIMKEHKISEDNVYKLLEPAVVGIKNLEKWLKEQSNRNKSDIRNYGEIFLNTSLKKYISNQELDKVHELIMTNGSADISQLFQPIIMLYIRKADWDTLLEYIKQICYDDRNLTHLTVDNILLILARHLEEFKSLDLTSDFVYYLQQIVSKNFHSSIRNQKVLKKLIQQSLELPHETVQSLIACSQMFRILAEIKWIQSGFGFEEALKVCNFFQFSDFPNGIICLLHYATRIGDENLISKALTLARTYWPEWKVSITFASIMICSEKLEEANCLLQKANIRWINVLQTYKLLCILHLDEVLQCFGNLYWRKEIGFSQVYLHVEVKLCRAALNNAFFMLPSYRKTRESLKMNIFRLTADLAHLIAIFILALKMWTTRSVAGISGRSQLLFAAVFTSRYLDLFTNFISIYNSAMKIFFLVSSFGTLYLMWIKFKATYDRNHDTFLNRIFSASVMWTFSIYLEAVAIMPQLFMLSRTGSAETITAHYLFALGSYRALYILNWIYRYYMEGFFDPIAVISGVVQTVLYADFFYLYISRVLRQKRGLQLSA
ncbi:ER lumen protein-retaining receptor [Dirofilaria immitis]|nr:ER lumen protein-retaining receptor [Dirofilaria immitis]